MVHESQGNTRALDFNIFLETKSIKKNNQLKIRKQIQ